MEHVRTFLFSKIFSTKERRFLYDVETGEATPPVPEGIDADAEARVGGLEAMTAEDRERIAREYIRSLPPEKRSAFLQSLEDSADEAPPVEEEEEEEVVPPVEEEEEVVPPVEEEEEEEVVPPVEEEEEVVPPVEEEEEEEEEVVPPVEEEEEEEEEVVPPVVEDPELTFAKNRFEIIKGMLNEQRDRLDASDDTDMIDNLREYRKSVQEAIANRRNQIQERVDQPGVDPANDPLMTELRNQITELQNEYLAPYADRVIPEEDKGIEDAEVTDEAAEDNLEAAASAQRKELADALNSSESTAEDIEKKRIALDSAIDTAVGAGSATPEQVNKWLEKAEIDGERKLVYKDGDVVIETPAASDTEAPAGAPKGAESSEEEKTAWERIVAKILEILEQLLDHAKENGRLIKEQAGAQGRPTTLTEAQAQAAADTEAAAAERQGAKTLEGQVATEAAQEEGTGRGAGRAKRRMARLRRQVDEQRARAEEAEAQRDESVQYARDLEQMIAEQEEFMLGLWSPFARENNLPELPHVDPDAGIDSGFIYFDSYRPELVQVIQASINSGNSMFTGVEESGGTLVVHIDRLVIDQSTDQSTNVVQTATSTVTDNSVTNIESNSTSQDVVGDGNVVGQSSETVQAAEGTATTDVDTETNVTAEQSDEGGNDGNVVFDLPDVPAEVPPADTEEPEGSRVDIGGSRRGAGPDDAVDFELPE